MLCDNKCGGKAIYQQNQYTILCITCWYKVAKNMFDAWSDNKKEPTPWIFNRDRVIKGKNYSL